MFKSTKIFISTLIALSGLSISACSFLGGNSKKDDDPSTPEEKKPTLEIKTDNILVYDSEQNLYQMSLVSGESYQLNVTMGDYSGNDYYLTYEVSDGKEYASVSSTGFVSTVSNLSQNKTAIIALKVMNRSNKVYLSKSIVLRILKNENQPPEINVEIVFKDGIELNESQDKYTLSLESGNSFDLSPNKITTYNIDDYLINYDLKSVNPEGAASINNSTIQVVSGLKVDGSAVVEITVTSLDKNEIYATFIIEVTLLKEVAVMGTFKIYRGDTDEEIINNSTIDLFESDELAIYGKLNDGIAKISTATTTNEFISVTNNEGNYTINALKEGKVSISFTYHDDNDFDYEISFNINIKANVVTEIYSTNGEDSFIYLNGDLVVLDDIFAKYSNGNVINITDNDGLSKIVNPKDTNTKELVLSYAGVSITYTVNSYQTGDYSSTKFPFNIRQLKKSMSTGYSTLPLEGDVKLLVVPVWHSDSNRFFKESQQEQILTDIQEKVFGEDEWSLKSYYEAESRNKITISGKVSEEFYLDENPLTKYGDADGRIDYVNQLAHEAQAWYFANTEDTISDYDMNLDNRVDCLILYYAGNFYGSNYKDNRSTAFCSSFLDYDGLNDPDGTKVKINTYCFCSIGSLYGLNAETKVATQLASDDLSSINPTRFKYGSATTIHEVGHAFGAFDLYTEAGNAYTSTENKYEPAGTFSMQKDNTGGHDPMHTNLFGWTSSYIFSADKYEIGEKLTVKLEDFQKSGKTILLTPNMNDLNSPFDEYMLLELFDTTGLNRFNLENNTSKCSKEPGIRLWHIDDSLEWANNGKTGEYYDPTAKQSLEFIGNNHLETEQGYHLAHFIRNDENEIYKSDSNFNENNIFKAGDSFSMEKFKNQFKKPGYFDDGRKLGWEFEVKEIFDENGTSTAIIELTRVDNTIVEFEDCVDLSSINISTDQPENDVTDYTEKMLPNNNDLTITYKLNEGTKPNGYDYVSYKGIYLYPNTNGNGNALEITLKEKANYTCYIYDIEVYYFMVTNASLTVYANDEEINGEKYTGPENPYQGMNDYAVHYSSLHASKITIQNQYEGVYTGYPHTELIISSVKILYKMIPNNLLSLYE